MLEVSSAINNLEYDLELYNHFKNILIEKLNLGRAILISDNDGWEVNIKFGIEAFNEEDFISKCLEFDRITVLNTYNDSVFSEFDVIIPIFHKSKTLSYLLLGDFDGEKIEVSPIIRHLPFIQTLTNLIVVAQENKRLFAENLENAAMQKEVELASRMQNMLIPKQIPERKDLDIYALYQPHQIVGGDYYDFFQISDKQTVFCMADVSGKGMSAAMLMSNFQAMMHAMLEHSTDLKILANSLNRRVASNTQGEKFITAFVAVYDHENKELTYINSGHQPALFYHNGEVIELKEGSPILGAFDELPHLNIGKQKVSKNDILVCFTDGVCEVENMQNDEFGTEIIKSVIPKFNNAPVKEMVDAIMEEISIFKGDKDYQDDLALLSIRFSH